MTIHEVQGLQKCVRTQFQIRIEDQMKVSQSTNSQIMSGAKPHIPVTTDYLNAPGGREAQHIQHVCVPPVVDQKKLRDQGGLLTSEH